MAMEVGTVALFQKPKIAPEIAQKPEIVFQALFAAREHDRHICETTACVPRRIYAGPHKTYLGLRVNTEEAGQRVVKLFGKNCSMSRHSLFTLRVQFTAPGFAKYATTLLGSESNFSSMLHKVVYENDRSGTDWGVWAFHGGLPLCGRAADAQLQIIFEWVQII